jgi:hypothetical protein
MGYLICEKCEGYYELQEGESQEDFEQCHCGGKLKYSVSLQDAYVKPSEKIGNVSTETVQNGSSNQTRNKDPVFTDFQKNTMEKKFCSECGAEIRKDSLYCYRCKKPYYSEFKEEKKISRTIELLLGILGGIFGIFGAIAGILLGSIGAAFAASGSGEVTVLGTSALFASIVGIGGAAFVLRDAKIGGIILIISAIWLLISISLFGILGAVLLGLAGLLAIFRK